MQINTKALAGAFLVMVYVLAAFFNPILFAIPIGLIIVVFYGGLLYLALGGYTESKKEK